MTRGRITVVGNAGMHLGAYMKGGAIEVSGNASDWVGAEMAGGLIRIRGNAGGQVGAAYRGSLAGMKDGTILIERLGGHGSRHADEAGHHRGRRPGARLRRLADEGRDHFPARRAEIRTGAWMVRGTIVSLTPIALLPTFAYACTYPPVFASVCQAPADAGVLHSPGSRERGLSTLHGRRLGSRQRGDSRLAAARLLIRRRRHAECLERRVFTRSPRREKSWRTTSSEATAFGGTRRRERSRASSSKRRRRQREFRGRTRHASKEEPQYLLKSEKTGREAMHKGSALRKVGGEKS